MKSNMRPSRMHTRTRYSRSPTGTALVVKKQYISSGGVLDFGRKLFSNYTARQLCFHTKLLYVQNCVFKSLHL
jgi:hypothetical protein